MKKMKLVYLTAALAAALIVSGCTANEAKTADAAGTSAVTAHETTGETEPVAASEKTNEKPEAAAENMSENKSFNVVGMEEIDVSQLLEEEKEAEADSGEDSNYIDNDDMSEDSDLPEEEEDEEEEDEENEEDDEEEENEDENEALYLDDASEEFIGALSPIDNGTYPCSVILVCTTEDTTALKIQELISKYDLGIVYDYDEMNMYAFSTPEPLDREATKKLIDELEKYDFVLSAEPDQVIHLDDPVMPSPGNITIV